MFPLPAFAHTIIIRKPLTFDPCSGPKKYFIHFCVSQNWAYPRSGPKMIDFVMILLINRKGKKRRDFLEQLLAIIHYYFSVFTITEGPGRGRGCDAASHGENAASLLINIAGAY